MHLWTDGERNHEWQESMAIFGRDQHPEQIIETKGVVTMINLDGDYKVYDWLDGPPDNVAEPKGQCIQYINYTGEYDPITIGDFQWSNVYGGELTSYAVFPTWNHWPVAQMPSDGRYAIFPDRTAHSSLTHVGPSIYNEVLNGPTPFYQKILIEGMLNKDNDELVTIAKSWLEAPQLNELVGAVGKYEPGQRAYILSKEKDDISFVIKSISTRPMYNACFLVKGWNSINQSEIFIYGVSKTESQEVKQGIVRDTDGTNTLVVWIEKQSSKPVSVKIIQTN